MYQERQHELGNKRASSATDEGEVTGQVRSAGGESVASIVGDSDVGGGHIDRQTGRNGEELELWVGDLAFINALQTIALWG